MSLDIFVEEIFGSLPTSVLEIVRDFRESEDELEKIQEEFDRVSSSKKLSVLNQEAAQRRLRNLIADAGGGIVYVKEGDTPVLYSVDKNTGVVTDTEVVILVDNEEA